MKLRWQHVFCAALILAAVVAGIVWLRASRPPLTIVRAYRTPGSTHVVLDIRNNAPDRVRLYSVWLWARSGTNWALVGTVPLGFTNCTERSLSIGVDFPAASTPPWKSTLVYMPAFNSFKLLKARLKETWNTRNVRRGFLTTGWEGSRKLDSPEIMP